MPSENKRDSRTIEQVMAENRARKKLKTEHDRESTTASETSKPEATASAEDTS